jgi:hypothetical protein
MFEGLAYHTSLPAPILDDINISYDIVQFDGRFVKENIYRQKAGPEVDAAWEALGVGCEFLDSFRYPTTVFNPDD